MDNAPGAANRVLGFCLPGGRDRDKPHNLHAEIVICSKLLGPDGNPDQLDHTLLHELMHFLGLDHFETPYRGETQIMHSMEDTSPVLKQGDIHGLQYLVRDQLFEEPQEGSDLLGLTFKVPAGPDGMVVQVHGPGGSACTTLRTTRLQPEPEEGDGQVNGCPTQ